MTHINDRGQVAHPRFAMAGENTETLNDQYALELSSSPDLPKIISNCALVYHAQCPLGCEEVRTETERAWVVKSGLSPSDISVIMRGTVTDHAGDPVSFLGNVLTDLKFRLATLHWYPQGTQVQVHTGFLEAFERLRGELKQVIEEVVGDRRDSLVVTFAGHSLGAALATLGAAYFSTLGYKVKLVTCGSPRVGNKEFVEFYKEQNIPTCRLINRLDPVAHLPLGSEEGSINSPMSGHVEGFLKACLPQDRLAAGEYHHVCSSMVLDSTVALVESGMKIISDGSLSATDALLELVGYHSVQLYVQNVRGINRPASLSLALAAQTVVKKGKPMLTAVCERCITTAPATPVASNSQFAQNLFAFTGIPIGPSIVAVASSAITCAIVMRRLGQMEIGMKAGQQELQCSIERFRESSAGMYKSLRNDISAVGNQITELKREVSRAADHAVTEKVVLDAQKVHKTLTDELGRAELRLKHIEDARNRLDHEYNGVYLRFKELVRRGRDARGAGQHMDADQLFQETAPVLSMMLSVLETMLVTDLLLGQKPPVMQWIQDLGPIAGTFLWLAVKTVDAQWTLALEGKLQNLFDLVIPMLQAHNDSLTDLLQESPQAALLLDPLSVGIRAALMLQMHESEAFREELGAVEAAWECLNHHTSRMTMLQYKQQAAIAGLAALAACRFMGGREEEAMQGAVKFLACAADHDVNGLCRVVDETQKNKPDLPWKECLAEAQRQKQTRLGLVLLPPSSELVSNNWPVSDASLEDVMGMDERPNIVKHFQQLEHADMKRVLANHKEALVRFLKLVGSIELDEEKRPRIAAIRNRVQGQWESIEETKDVVIFGGLVSSGKTSLINALIKSLLPSEWWTSLAVKPEDEDQYQERSFLATDFDENTMVITEVEFYTSRSNDDSEPVEFVLLQSENTHLMRFEPHGRSEKLSFTEAQQRLHGKKLQQDIENIKSAGLLGRVHLKIGLPPCSAQLPRPLSIIDTPGLSGVGVWPQLKSLVLSKAFLFVWVGSLHDPVSFGQEGVKLVELMHLYKCAVPPVLVLTKWDRAKEDKDLPKKKIKQRARDRVQALIDGLSFAVDEKADPHCISDSAELQELLKSLGCDEPSDLYGGVQLSGSEDEVLVQHAAIVGPHRLKPGDKFLGPMSLLQTRDLPAQVELKICVSGCRPFLAATDARAALATAGVGEDRQTTAKTTLQELWTELMTLTTSLGEPIRMGKQLAVVRNAVQDLINIVLKDDQIVQAHTQDYMKSLQEFKEEGIKNFSQLVSEYLAHLPVDEHALRSYTPLNAWRGGDRTATLKNDIKRLFKRAEYQNLTWGERMHRVAQAAFTNWKQGFEASLRVQKASSCLRLRAAANFSKDCDMEPTSPFRAHELVSATAEVQAEFQRTISSEKTWSRAGRGAESLCVGVAYACGTAAWGAPAWPLVAAGVAVGAKAARWCAYTASAANEPAAAEKMLLEYPDLGKLAASADVHLRLEQQHSAVINAVLRALSDRTFQEVALKHVTESREGALEECLSQFARVRSGFASPDNQAGSEAGSLKADFGKRMQFLEVLLERDLAERVNRDGWLAPPPKDLRSTIENKE